MRENEAKPGAAFLRGQGVPGDIEGVEVFRPDPHGRVDAARRCQVRRSGKPGAVSHRSRQRQRCSETLPETGRIDHAAAIMDDKKQTELRAGSVGTVTAVQVDEQLLRCRPCRPFGIPLQLGREPGWRFFAGLDFDEARKQAGRMTEEIAVVRNEVAERRVMDEAEPFVPEDGKVRSLIDGLGRRDGDFRDEELVEQMIAARSATSIRHRVAVVGVPEQAKSPLRDGVYVRLADAVPFPHVQFASGDERLQMHADAAIRVEQGWEGTLHVGGEGEAMPAEKGKDGHGMTGVST